MRRRHPVPRLWLMTDPRMGKELWAALERLPRGAGVVFRHYHLPEAERRLMVAKVAHIAVRRGLVLVRAGKTPMRGERGVHNNQRERRNTGIVTQAVHSRRELVRAERAGVDAVFVSPVFATRSHPGAPGIGVIRLGLMIQGARVPVIALGGMDARRMRRLRELKLHGWAGIDAWLT